MKFVIDMANGAINAAEIQKISYNNMYVYYSLAGKDSSNSCGGMKFCSGSELQNIRVWSEILDFLTNGEDNGVFDAPARMKEIQMGNNL